MTSSKVIPPKNAARYMAGEYVCREGAKTESELLVAINFGARESAARENLQRSIASGWLVSTAGLVTCGASARAHYESRLSIGPDRSLPEQPKGPVVPPRFVDLLYGPELSRKYIPNRRGPRIDAPDCSLAAMPSKYHKG